MWDLQGVFNPLFLYGTIKNDEIINRERHFKLLIAIILGGFYKQRRLSLSEAKYS